METPLFGLNFGSTLTSDIDINIDVDIADDIDVDVVSLRFVSLVLHSNVTLSAEGLIDARGSDGMDSSPPSAPSSTLVPDDDPSKCWSR